MRQDHQISVAPVEGGWAVRCAGQVEPMMFLSGRKAEAQARALAACLSALGEDAHVLIHDRTSQLVGATRYLAK